MGKKAYECLDTVFGAGLTNDIATKIDWVLSAMDSIMQVDKIQAIIAFLTGLAFALLFMYFAIDVVGQSTKDMLTIEKFFMSMIKVLIGMIIVAYLPTILHYLFMLMKAVYNGTASTLPTYFSSTTINTGIKFEFGSYSSNTFPATYETVKDSFDDVFGGLNTLKLFNTMGIFLIWFFNQIITIGIYLFICTNALSLIIQMIYAPIGIANMYSGGGNSDSIKNLKRFAATALTFAMILAISYVSTMLNTSLVASFFNNNQVIAGIDNASLTLTEDNIELVFENSELFWMIIGIKCATLGGIAKTGQLANQLLGV